MSDLRNTIMQAASDCFDKKGVRASSMKTIADRAGVSEKDIKAEFGNKSLLVMAVQSQAIEKMERQYLAQVPDASIDETVKFIIHTRMEFIESHYEQTEIFVRNALNGKEPWSTALDQTIWRLSVEFATLFEKAHRRGEISKDSAISIAVRSIMSFYLTGLVTIGLRGEGFDADKVWQFMEPQVALVLEGLRC